MPSTPARFALFFGNRGFFPSALISHARRQMQEVLSGLGHETILLDAEATRFGAVETPEEGRRYAAFLEQNRGRYDGVILCLPNFSDENGAVDALRNARVPILIHAYPDEMNKLASESRRDAFCGKISIMDVFCQQGIKFTALKPHVVDPASSQFAQNVDYFDRVCRTVAGMKDVRVGAIGARTTAFKTVRIDELALQRKGVTVETYDLSSIIARAKAIDPASDPYRAKAAFLKNYADWTGVPDESFANICRLGAVLDEIIERDSLRLSGHPLLARTATAVAHFALRAAFGTERAGRPLRLRSRRRQRGGDARPGAWPPAPRPHASTGTTTTAMILKSASSSIAVPCRSR